ncbi:MAG: hypothetical protein SOV56_05850 [Phascolarctobacterium sp.]|nr:hypothetical protein [Phascolarctobacterium sp.]
MKKLLLLLTLLMSITMSAFAAGHSLVGHFVLRNDINPTNDMLLLNHLMKYNNQDLNNYRVFAVYCSHSHDDDLVKNTIGINAIVVPVDSHGKDLDKAGADYATYGVLGTISTAGTWRYTTNFMMAMDSVTNDVIYKKDGELGREPLYADSAAIHIANLTGPHPTMFTGHLQSSATYPNK